MAARAMWKGRIRLGGETVPVKLYAAVENRRVHFRMLHRKDKAPVKQIMLNPDTEQVVSYGDARRGWVTGDGDMVLLDPEELDELKPEPSRDIDIVAVLPTARIDHRWYDRPYYLGPDGDEEDYFALADALQAADREGLARWVMRRKAYVGALRVHRGYPMLITLRPEAQVVSSSELEPPRGRQPDKRELDMARQLIGMLEADFEPEAFQDTYQDRLRELIEKKRKGRKIEKAPAPKREQPDDLAAALEASLRQAGNG
jgi:DNA end-binding protein Ku